MIEEGQIVLFHFTQSDLKKGKLRPALVIRKTPGKYNDWLICMISSRTYQKYFELDEIINLDDDDFCDSGLKTTSVIRCCRLAVVEQSIFIGKLGNISLERLKKIKEITSKWILG